jgi:SAM-dependent methyltransferase
LTLGLLAALYVFFRFLFAFPCDRIKWRFSTRLAGVAAIGHEVERQYRFRWHRGTIAVGLRPSTPGALRDRGDRCYPAAARRRVSGHMGRNVTQPPRKQDRNYWDRMARRWDHEIFNTLYHDRFRVITAELKRSVRRARSVADFGCGVGTYLPILGRLFEEVQGFERSRACVAIARASVRKKGNIAVHQAASAPRQSRAQFDVVLCVNVAIHPSHRGRTSVLRSARSLLSPGGRLILVVPSFESAAMVATAEREAIGSQASRRAGHWDVGARPNGVVSIDGVPTKHYSRQELRDSLISLGLTVTRVRRVEYSWRSQGVRPGPKLRHRLPWDWIAVAQESAAAHSAKPAVAA